MTQDFKTHIDQTRARELNSIKQRQVDAGINEGFLPVNVMADSKENKHDLERGEVIEPPQRQLEVGNHIRRAKLNVNDGVFSYALNANQVQRQIQETHSVQTIKQAQLAIHANTEDDSPMLQKEVIAKTLAIITAEISHFYGMTFAEATKAMQRQDYDMFLENEFTRRYPWLAKEQAQELALLTQGPEPLDNLQRAFLRGKPDPTRKARRQLELARQIKAHRENKYSGNLVPLWVQNIDVLPTQQCSLAAWLKMLEHGPQLRFGWNNRNLPAGFELTEQGLHYVEDEQHAKTNPLTLCLVATPEPALLPVYQLKQLASTYPIIEQWLDEPGDLSDEQHYHDYLRSVQIITPYLTKIAQHVDIDAFQQNELRLAADIIEALEKLDKERPRLFTQKNLPNLADLFAAADTKANRYKDRYVDRQKHQLLRDNFSHQRLLKALTIHWLNKNDQALLALKEILTDVDIPLVVSIFTAVQEQLAKKYAPINDDAFIFTVLGDLKNAVLACFPTFFTKINAAEEKVLLQVCYQYGPEGFLALVQELARLQHRDSLKHYFFFDPENHRGSVALDKAISELSDNEQRWWWRLLKQHDNHIYALSLQACWEAFMYFKGELALLHIHLPERCNLTHNENMLVALDRLLLIVKNAEEFAHEQFNELVSRERLTLQNSYDTYAVSKQGYRFVSSEMAFTNRDSNDYDAGKGPTYFYRYLGRQGLSYPLATYHHIYQLIVSLRENQHSSLQYSLLTSVFIGLVKQKQTGQKQVLNYLEKLVPVILQFPRVLLELTKLFSAPEGQPVPGLLDIARIIDHCHGVTQEKSANFFLEIIALYEIVPKALVDEIIARKFKPLMEFIKIQRQSNALLQKKRYLDEEHREQLDNGAVSWIKFMTVPTYLPHTNHYKLGEQFRKCLMSHVTTNLSAKEYMRAMQNFYALDFKSPGLETSYGKKIPGSEGSKNINSGWWLLDFLNTHLSYNEDKPIPRLTLAQLNMLLSLCLDKAKAEKSAFMLEGDDFKHRWLVDTALYCAGKLPEYNPEPSAYRLGGIVNNDAAELGINVNSNEMHFLKMLGFKKRDNEKFSVLDRAKITVNFTKMLTEIRADSSPAGEALEELYDARTEQRAQRVEAYIMLVRALKQCRAEKIMHFLSGINKLPAYFTATVATRLFTHLHFHENSFRDIDREAELVKEIVQLALANPDICHLIEANDNSLVPISEYGINAMRLYFSVFPRSLETLPVANHIAHDFSDNWYDFAVTAYQMSASDNTLEQLNRVFARLIDNFSLTDAIDDDELNQFYKTLQRLMAIYKDYPLSLLHNLVEAGEHFEKLSVLLALAEKINQSKPKHYNIVEKLFARDDQAFANIALLNKASLETLWECRNDFERMISFVDSDPDGTRNYWVMQRQKDLSTAKQRTRQVINSLTNEAISEALVHEIWQQLQYINAITFEYALPDCSTPLVRCSNETLNGLWLTDDLKPEVYLAIARETLYRTTAVKGKGEFARNTQLIAVLLISQHQYVLSQVLAGEGKSCISALLAAMSLKANNDITFVTSNLVLAERDAQKYQGFFQSLGIAEREIGVLSLMANEGSEHPIRDNYRVAYTDAPNLAQYFMRAEVNGIELQEGQQTFIFDEVDKLLLDNTTRFNYALAGTEIPVEIYHLVNDFIDSSPAFADQSISYQEDILYCLDYIITQNPTYAYLNQPKYYTQVDLWLHSATIAKRLRANVDYTIVVTAETTNRFHAQAAIIDSEGFTQLEPRWVFAIHQCLHARLTDNQLALTEEGMTPIIELVANHQAGDNRDYYFAVEAEQLIVASHTALTLMKTCMDLDTSRVYGLTGTLGTPAEIRELEATFINRHNQGFTFLSIPPEQDSLRISHDTQYVKSLPQKLQAILKVIKQCQKQQQPVLVFGASVSFVEKLQQFLLDNGFAGTNISICTAKTTVDMDKITIKNAGNDNKITLATNKLGRGTDIKTTHPKGLFVIIAHAPDFRELNQVEARTARNHQLGETLRICSFDEYQTAHDLFLESEAQVLSDEQQYRDKVKSAQRYLNNALSLLRVQAREELKNHLSQQDTIFTTLGLFYLELDVQWLLLLENNALNFNQASLSDFQQLINDFSVSTEQALIRYVLRYSDGQPGVITMFEPLQPVNTIPSAEKATQAMPHRASQYESGHAGRNVSYTKLFAEERALLQRGLFPNTRRWLHGNGALFPQTRALVSGKRRLFENTRTTWAAHRQTTPPYQPTYASIVDFHAVNFAPNTQDELFGLRSQWLDKQIDTFRFLNILSSYCKEKHSKPLAEKLYIECLEQAYFNEGLSLKDYYIELLEVSDVTLSQDYMQTLELLIEHERWTSYSSARHHNVPNGISQLRLAVQAGQGDDMRQRLLRIVEQQICKPSRTRHESTQAFYELVQRALCPMNDYYLEQKPEMLNKVLIDFAKQWHFDLEVMLMPVTKPM